MAEQILRELRLAFRSVKREPLFALGVIATFALSIGTNAAMLGLVTRLMIAPPPGIGAVDRVMRVQIEHVGYNGEPFAMSTMSYPAAIGLAEQKRVFSASAAVIGDTVAIGRGDQLAQATAIQASGEYFRVMQAAPALGRFFGPADDVLPLGNLVVVLSHAYWQAHFSGDPGVLGRELVIDDQPFTIIGVAARGFNGDGLGAIDLFMPLTAALRNRDFGWWTNDRINMVWAVVRLADGVDAAMAAQIATTTLPMASFGADDAPKLRLEPVVPGASSRQSPQARIALWLSGVSIIVLLIATANVSTLLLLRAARKRLDFAVRIAIGAGRYVLIRQMVVESLTLALTGAIAGLLLSRWFSTVLRNTLLPGVAPGEAFIDRRVLVASVLLAILAGLVAGLAPIAQLRNTSISQDLRVDRGTFQNALVALQVALCTILLIGAGLFVRSLQRVQSQDLGFTTTDLTYVTLDFRLSLPGAEQDRSHEEAVRRMRAIPGVTAVAPVQAMPFGSFHVPPLSVPGLPEMPTIEGQPPFMYGATLDYLRMMQVTLRDGRLFNESDTRTSPLVVLVNESMARHLWPNEPALGKCIRAGYGPGMQPGMGNGNPADTAPCREVVGVVRDSRARSLRPDGNEARYMQFYVPFAQLPVPPAPNYSAINGILVQSVAGANVSSAIQRTVQSDASVPLYARVRSYQDLIDPQLRSWRLGATLFSAFSLLALAIGAVGLFGVVSYRVSQRTREIGVRIALGATRQLLWRMVITDSLRLVVVGITTGAIAALAAGAFIRELLFQTQPWEPANIALAVSVLVLVTIAAALWPAWRAARVDPLKALRT